jgi:hypothetical protein
MSFIRKHQKVIYYSICSSLSIGLFILIFYYNLFEAPKNTYYLSHYYESSGNQELGDYYERVSIFQQNFVIFTLLITFVLFNLRFMSFVKDYSNYPSILVDYRRLSAIKNSGFSLMLCVFLILMTLNIPFTSINRFSSYYSRFFITFYLIGMWINNLGNKKSQYVEKRMKEIEESNFTTEDSIEYRPFNMKMMRFVKGFIAFFFIINFVLISYTTIRFLDYQKNHDYPNQLILNKDIQFDNGNVCTGNRNIGCQFAKYETLLDYYQPVKVEVTFLKEDLKDLNLGDYKLRIHFGGFTPFYTVDSDQLIEQDEKYILTINLKDQLDHEGKLHYVTLLLVKKSTEEIVEGIYEHATIEVTMELIN